MSLEKLAGCLIIENEKVLLLKEKKDWYWKLLGGRIEDWETPEGCAIREAKEEASIDVELLRLLGKYTFNFKNRNFELNVYEARIIGGTPKVRETHLEACDWFPLESLNLENMAPPNKLIYSDLIRRIADGTRNN